MRTGSPGEQMSREELGAHTRRVAGALGETEHWPKVHIWRLLWNLGVESVDELLRDTLEIESKGGLMLNDGSRRHTTGGVFYHLAKQRLTDQQRSLVFHGPTKYKRRLHNRLKNLSKKIKKAKARKAQAQASTNTPPLDQEAQPSVSA